ncbi:hypothetical protein [Hyphomicrobium sp.]|uniref:hypothetical protein n=1 Tax=Hyphomicrobium sp. TaxID=82 RepID=UPI000F9B80C5|nr:hypothetical protein [Hyphomicrobium sp.]RUO98594.1 MAG: hypothetical protein EKK30_10230 [Hyphomicrobium sp.]
MADDPSLKAIVTELARETSSYGQKRGELERLLEGMVPDPADAVGDLMSWSEEFGREHAIELFQNDLHTYPANPEVTEELWPERARQVSEGVDALLDSQDRLDELTLARERAEGRQGTAERALNIQGEEFELDGGSRILRDREGHEIDLGVEPELSLTQEHARDVGAGPAQPDRGDHDRTRERSR